jgi:hypothetical protein
MIDAAARLALRQGRSGRGWSMRLEATVGSMRDARANQRSSLSIENVPEKLFKALSKNNRVDGGL